MLDVRRAPYAFLAPFLIVFAVFWCWPLVQSVLLSFQNTRVYPWTFDPMVNWRRLLIDRAFQNALWNTLLVLAVQVPFMLALADKGWQAACSEDPHLLAGLNVHAGKLTNYAVGRALGIDVTSPGLAVKG